MVLLIYILYSSIEEIGIAFVKSSELASGFAPFSLLQNRKFVQSMTNFLAYLSADYVELMIRSRKWYQALRDREEELPVLECR